MRDKKYNWIGRKITIDFLFFFFFSDEMRQILLLFSFFLNFGREMDVHQITNFGYFNKKKLFGWQRRTEKKN
jgi:hypothetical protein